MAKKGLSKFELENSNLYFSGITEGSVTGTFATVSTSGAWSDLPSTENTTPYFLTVCKQLTNILKR